MSSQVLVGLGLDELEEFKTVCYFGHALLRATSQNLERVHQFVKENFARCSIHVLAVDLSVEDVLSLLNGGVVQVFLPQAQLKDILEHGGLEEYGRLVVKVDSLVKPEKDGQVSEDDRARAIEEMAKQAALIRETAPGVGLHFEAADQAMLKALTKASSGKGRAYVASAEDTLFAARCAVAAGFTPIVCSSLFRKAPSGEFSSSIEALFTSYMESDRPDGLYPTTVVDERGALLGLVYSNDQSVKESLKHGRGIYWSRKRGLWPKGESSGDIQELIRIEPDCDNDTLNFVVRQKGDGFCHLKTATCFGPYAGLSRLEKTLQARKASAPPGSYTSRLFNDSKLLQAKIMEEASELCEAQSREDVAAEAADLLYFALTKCAAAGVSLDDVEKNLDLKALKVSRRKGDAKPEWAKKVDAFPSTNGTQQKQEAVKEAASVPKSSSDPAGTVDGRIQMRRLDVTQESAETIEQALQRPAQRSNDEIMGIVRPIIERVRTGGDAALLEYTHRFEKATSLQTPVLEAPFPPELMQLPQDTIDAMELTFRNIERFHAAQREAAPLVVETMEGVTCARFARPIASVGLYVPGGTAVLPSTALMLGIPAMAAGCRTIVLASPPRRDGTPSPELVYAAHRVGARCIVLAGGAQAVAALAHGTPTVPKVDKILGPGNQFVTAAKLLVATDPTARVAIDMPAGPSEVLVIADATANPAFVAADLLSQAEHGVDSQVVLLAVALSAAQMAAIEDEVNRQARALPRVDIVRGAVAHSVTLAVPDVAAALRWSNAYAPEHLILQVRDAAALVARVENAGSVFVGPWAPESVGDYSAGVNHSLLAVVATAATYGYAKQYSGVNLGSFTKHITSSTLTPAGLKRLSGAVMRLAEVEELEAHRRAVQVRLDAMAAGEAAEAAGT